MYGTDKEIHRTMKMLKKTLMACAMSLSIVVTGAVAAPAASAATPTGNESPAASLLVASVGNPLSETEIDGLTYMREEEKLARDVYLALYDQWGQQTFTNIARSEQAHMNAIATLLDRYDIPDPAAGKDLGEFTNPDLQALYDQLVATGSQSLADALKVGLAIEEIDIQDLIEELDAVTHSDVQRVYESLKWGSENHLRAFATALERQTGESYEPEYLDQETYDAILSASRGQGRRRGPRW
jgi:hypothetical protein